MKHRGKQSSDPGKSTETTKHMKQKTGSQGEKSKWIPRTVTSGDARMIVGSLSTLKEDGSMGGEAFSKKFKV
jgi:hypothetical protein